MRDPVTARLLFARVARAEARHHFSEPTDEEEWKTSVFPGARDHIVRRDEVEGDRLVRAAALAEGDARDLARGRRGPCPKR